MSIGIKTIKFPHPKEFLQNVKVLAFKRNNTNPDITSKIDSITTIGINETNCMFDNDTNTVGIFNQDKACIFIKPSKKGFTLRSICIDPATPIKAHFSVKMRQNRLFKEVCAFDADRTVLRNDVGYDILVPIAIAIPEVKSEEFRIDKYQHGV